MLTGNCGANNLIFKTYTKFTRKTLSSFILKTMPLFVIVASF